MRFKIGVVGKFSCSSFDNAYLNTNTTDSHAATLSTLGSSYEAFIRGRSLIEEVPRKAIGYTSAMILFAALQESLRALRRRHDSINSGVAGAIAGALVAGHYQGPQYRLLAASLWGPICLASHIMNDLVRPRPMIEDWLISEGLLSPVVLERRAKLVQASQQESVPIKTLVDMATRVRDRELQTLFNASRTETIPKSKVKTTAAAAGQRIQEEDGEDNEYKAWLVEATKAGIAILLDPSEEEEKEAKAPQRAHRSWVDWLKGKPKPKEPDQV